MGRLARISLATVLFLAGLVLTACGGASGPRFYTAKPQAAMASWVRQLERDEGLTGADCSLEDGNRRDGWRDVRCAGNLSHSGTTYRFNLVETPQSCTRVHETITTSVGVESRTIAWHHLTFTCKR